MEQHKTMRRLLATAILAALAATGAGAAPRRAGFTPPVDMIGVHGYRVHCGYTNGGPYPMTVDVPVSATNFTIDLPTNRNAWIVMSSVNALGLSGDYSVQLVHDALDQVIRPAPPVPRWLETTVAWLRRVLGLSN